MARVCKPIGRVVVADLVLPREKVAAYDRMERLRDPSHVRVLTEAELGESLAAVGVVDLRWSGYRFELELGALLEASFPRPGDAGHVRALIEADIGVDDLGIGVRRKGNSVWLAYPIAIVAGIKASKPAEYGGHCLCAEDGVDHQAGCAGNDPTFAVTTKRNGSFALPISGVPLRGLIRLVNHNGPSPAGGLSESISRD
jgi:hypothetical protein